MRSAMPGYGSLWILAEQLDAGTQGTIRHGHRARLRVWGSCGGSPFWARRRTWADTLRTDAASCSPRHASIPLASAALAHSPLPCGHARRLAIIVRRFSASSGTQTDCLPELIRSLSASCLL